MLPRWINRSHSGVIYKHLRVSHIGVSMQTPGKRKSLPFYLCRPDTGHPILGLHRRQGGSMVSIQGPPLPWPLTVSSEMRFCLTERACERGFFAPPCSAWARASRARHTLWPRHILYPCLIPSGSGTCYLPEPLFAPIGVWALSTTLLVLIDIRSTCRTRFLLFGL